MVVFPTGYVLAGFFFIAGSIGKLSSLVIALAVTQMIAPLVLAIVPFCSKARVVHYIGLGLLFVVVLIHYGRASIS